MSTPKKRPVLKFLGKILNSPLVRGTIKTLPVGNWIYEVVENYQHVKNPDKSGMPLPHNPWSLFAQAVGFFLIIYAFVTHQITIDDVLRLIGSVPGLSVDPGNAVSPDSLLK